jgi:hypothetical protein
VPQAVEHCFETLFRILDLQVDFLTTITLVVIRGMNLIRISNNITDVLRKFPQHSEGVVSELKKLIERLKDSEGLVIFIGANLILK